MLKKITLLLLISFSLTSCFGGETDETESTTTLNLHDGEEFSILIPSTWEVIKDDTNILPKPSTGEVALAVSSTKDTDGFSNNLIILSERLDMDINSGEYSVLNNVGSKNEYYQYELLSTKDLSYSEQESLKLYVFQARYSEATPMLTFLQTAVVCQDDKRGYLLTIGLSKQITDYERYEDIFKNFTCK